jgi:peroxiredoxin
MKMRVLLAAALLAAAGTGGATEPGERAPDFRLPSFATGASVGSAQFRGKVVLVDFWASWCSPCRESLPLYNALKKNFPAADFALLAVGLDEDVDDARKFLRAHPIDYPALEDPQGEVAAAFGLKGMPSSYLIDRDGIVRFRHIGFAPHEIATLQREIAGLIAKADHAP